MINWLQQWFKSMCNEDWEHGQGIKIETLDNPGWSIEIDLNGTSIELKNFDWMLYEHSENNWIGFKVHDNVFISSGDALKLNLIIIVFKDLVEKGFLNENIIFEELSSINDNL